MARKMIFKILDFDKLDDIKAVEGKSFHILIWATSHVDEDELIVFCWLRSLFLKHRNWIFKLIWNLFKIQLQNLFEIYSVIPSFFPRHKMPRPDWADVEKLNGDEGP